MHFGFKTQRQRDNIPMLICERRKTWKAIQKVKHLTNKGWETIV